MSTIRVLQPPSTVDPYYRQAERLAEIERRLTLLERGPLRVPIKVGAGGGNPAFQNSYANYASATWATAQFWKVENRVYIEGLVYANNASGINVSVFTLPVGFRPALIHMFTMQGNGGLARVDVGSDGTVINRSTSGYASGATGGSSWFLSLDGINFPIGA